MRICLLRWGVSKREGDRSSDWKDRQQQIEISKRDDNWQTDKISERKQEKFEDKPKIY